MTVRILTGDCRTLLAQMPAESVQTCVTSPPYFGLRDYKIEASVWGGDPDCAHTFVYETVETEIGRGNWTQGVNGRGEEQPGGVDAAREPIRSSVKNGFCETCGAWLGVLGTEPSPQLFLEHMVEVFRAVHRVLRDDGTLWLNLGDSYATNGSRQGNTGQAVRGSRGVVAGYRQRPPGFKQKDLMMMPARLAIALCDDGWYLRSDIIWAKPNPMPESVTDRPTKAHEYIFLLSKSAKYYYDADAIAEPCSQSTHARVSQDVAAQIGSDRANGGAKTNGTMKAVVRGSGNKERKTGAERGRPGSHLGGSIPWNPSPKSAQHQDSKAGIKNNADFARATSLSVPTRNKRDVWTIGTEPFKDAHFATFPPALIEPAILAGAPRGGVVLDPFGGAGTTGLVADRLGRDAILCELNPAYAAMARDRIMGDNPLFTNVVHEATK